MTRRKINRLKPVEQKKQTNHGFGVHGFDTTAVGHGVTTQAQLGPHGARVATVVVVVVVVVITVRIRRQSSIDK